jgi:hypothetical protein
MVHSVFRPLFIVNSYRLIKEQSRVGNDRIRNFGGREKNGQMRGLVGRGSKRGGGKKGIRKGWKKGREGKRKG